MKKISDTSVIRLKCLEFIVNHDGNYRWPIFQMIEAEILFQYVTQGKLPTRNNEFCNAHESVDLLLERAFQELIKERDKGYKPTDSGNTNTNNLKNPESIFTRLFSRFRRK